MRGKRRHEGEITIGKETHIAWTKSTLNLAWGCTKISRECSQCYMYRLSPQFGRNPYMVKILGLDKVANADGLSIDLSNPKMISEFVRKFPEKMEHYKQEYVIPKIHGVRRLCFVNSMSDTFHKDIPDEILDIWFDALAQSRDKQWQILTKRPERAREYFNNRTVPDNCWIGTSCGIAEGVTRIGLLRQIDARIRFVSIEPLLEDLGKIDLSGIDWVIIGGETDYHRPRPMDVEWALNVIRQCREQKVAVWFKQMGGVGGDGSGGDVISGVQYHEFPAKYTEEK